MSAGTAADDDKFVANSGTQQMIEDDDEDISALISAQDSTLDDSLTSLPFDIDISSQHSSPRSTRYGSYDVNPSSVSSPVFEPDDREVPSPIGHLSQPIFTPPPPPDSPPPSAPQLCVQGCRNAEYNGVQPST